MPYQRRLLLGAYAGDGGQLAPEALLAAQRAVVRDAEAVRFIAHILHQVKRVGTPVQHDRVLPSRQIDLLKPLCQAKHGHARSRLLHGAVRKEQLFRAAVDQNHVRQLGKAARIRVQARLLALVALLQPMGEAAGDHLGHGGEVVGAFDGFDSVDAVCLFIRQSVLKDHHAGHAQNALRVGDIVPLNAPGQYGQMQRLLELQHGLPGAHVLDLRALSVLGERVLGVFQGQAHQIRLVAPLGHSQCHRPAPPLPQPALQFVQRFRQSLRQHVARDQMSIVVILGQESGQYLFRRLRATVLHQEGPSALNAPRTDMRQLHHGVLVILSHGQHILLHIARLNGVLFLHQLADIRDLVPQHRRLFVLHAGAGDVHLTGELGEQFPAVAVQKVDDARQDGAVRLLAHPARAGRQALPDLMVHAGTPGRFDGKAEIAGAQREKPPHFIHHLPDGGGPDIGAEVLHARPLVIHVAGQGQAGEGLVEVDTQIGVVFVILEKDVIEGAMLLDEVAFQRECLKVGLAEHEVKIIHAADHGGHLRRMRAVEILPHAVFQIDRLADVNDLAPAFHDIAAGAFGKHFDFIGQRGIHAAASFQDRSAHSVDDCSPSGAGRLKSMLPAPVRLPISSAHAPQDHAITSRRNRRRSSSGVRYSTTVAEVCHTFQKAVWISLGSTSTAGTHSGKVYTGSTRRVNSQASAAAQATYPSASSSSRPAAKPTSRAAYCVCRRS